MVNGMNREVCCVSVQQRYTLREKAVPQSACACSDTA